METAGKLAHQVSGGVAGHSPVHTYGTADRGTTFKEQEGRPRNSKEPVLPGLCLRRCEGAPWGAAAPKTPRLISGETPAPQTPGLGGYRAGYFGLGLVQFGLKSVANSNRILKMGWRLFSSAELVLLNSFFQPVHDTVRKLPGGLPDQTQRSQIWPRVAGTLARRITFSGSFPMLRNSASGPEIGLPGHISAGFLRSILRSSRLESGQNPARKPDFRPGNIIG